ncbi:MAG: PAS domain S-box protein, partial [Rhodobacterales bacterium]|nr:PAS domain S-box protein [Rhodobacterales bacterium]
MDSSYDPAGGVDEGFLADFKGPGLVCLADGTVAKANTKGASLASLMGQGLTDDLVNLMHQARTLGQVTVGEQILRGSKGDIVLEVTVVPLDGDGTCAVLARDTTMDRNLRTALVESRQRYKDLVEISSDFSWEVGLDGAFVFVSPRGAIGYAADELVGRQPADFVLDPDDYAPLPFTSPLQMDDVEMWMRRADGGLSCVLASCRPLLDADGTWRGTRGSCRDVTREREREAELNRARTREQVLNYVVR